MAEHIKIENVKTESFSMNYFRFGHGKETLVIVPGLSVMSVMYSADAVAEAYRSFADDYTVYVFDRRMELPLSYSVYDMAADTAEAIRALGLDRVSLFGASQGGMIAMIMAIKETVLVQKMILCSTSARVTEDQYRTVEKWVGFAKAHDAKDLYLSFCEAIYPRDMFERWQRIFAEFAKDVTNEDLERFIILAEGMKGFDVTGGLENITCPVFLAGSNDDRVLGAGASEYIAERFASKTGFVFHMYEGYGHAVYDTAPDFKERMLKFLKM